MTNLLVTARLKAASGIAEDDVSNSFAIAVPNTWDPATDLLNVTGPVAAFYNAAQSNGSSVGEFIGKSITRNASGIEIDVFDVTAKMNGEPHGSPIATDASTLLPVAYADELPREVSLVATLRAVDWDEQPIERPDGPDAGAALDRVRARYTGRIYVGPLAQVTSTSASGTSRPTGSFQTTVRLAVQKLDDDLEAAGFLGLCVWSRKDGAFRDVVRVETDDAWDTQRRRGVQATTRVGITV